MYGGAAASRLVKAAKMQCKNAVRKFWHFLQLSKNQHFMTFDFCIRLGSNELRLSQPPQNRQLFMHRRPYSGSRQG